MEFSPDQHFYSWTLEKMSHGKLFRAEICQGTGELKVERDSRMESGNFSNEWPWETKGKASTGKVERRNWKLFIMRTIRQFSGNKGFEEV